MILVSFKKRNWKC